MNKRRVSIPKSCIINEFMYQWTEEDVNGIVPSARYGHSMHYFENYIYLIGGISNEGRIKDIMKFDIKKRIWAKVFLKGEQSISRCYHSSCQVENKIFIFGGETDKRDLDELYDLRILPLKLLASKSNRSYFHNNLLTKFDASSSFILNREKYNKNI